MKNGKTVKSFTSEVSATVKKEENVVKVFFTSSRETAYYLALNSTLQSKDLESLIYIVTSHRVTHAECSKGKVASSQ